MPGRLRGARLAALMATWLVPPALAVALVATLPAKAELTPVALTSAVVHVPFTVARLVLREGSHCQLGCCVPWTGDGSSTGMSSLVSAVQGGYYLACQWAPK